MSATAHRRHARHAADRAQRRAGRQIDATEAWLPKLGNKQP